MRFLDLINEINYSNYRERYKEILTLGNNAKSREFKSSYISHLITMFQTYPIEKIYAVIDFLRNSDYQLYLDLIKTNNPIVMRVVVLLKDVNYISFDTIKYQREDAVNWEYTILLSRGVSEETKRKKLDCYDEEYQILSDYLKNFDDEYLRNTVDEDLVYFYKNIGNVSDVLFFQDNEKNARENIIYRLFDLKDKLGNETVTRIYNDVLLKNERLDPFNYNEIFRDRYGCENVRDIRGMIRKCNGDFFSDFAKGLYAYDNKKKWMSEFLKGVVETNKGDEKGLALFFTHLNVHLSKSQKNYLKKFDFYNYYSNINLEKIYSDAINKLILGENIDPIVRDTIGLCDIFLNKYNYFKDLFCKTNNPKIRENLITPLAVGLAEKERRKYDLDYFICLTNSGINNNTYGSYSKMKDTLYLNLFLPRSIQDKKLAFANLSDTVFHEVKHARQIRILSTDKSLNYKYLLMAMDSLLSDILPGYYKHEYLRLSYEIDAEESGLNGTITFFQGYPEMQNYLIQSHQGQLNNKRKSISTQFIRKNPMESDESSNLYGIVELFIKYCNLYLNKEGLNALLNRINEYPILNQFFEIAYPEKRIVPRSQEHFNKLLRKYEKEPNKIQREDAIYAIKMFNFIINVENEMRSKDKIRINLKYRNDREVFDERQRIPRR